jgi:alkylated DNA repair dioxygenase AlkB
MLDKDPEMIKEANARAQEKGCSPFIDQIDITQRDAVISNLSTYLGRTSMVTMYHCINSIAPKNYLNVLHGLTSCRPEIVSIVFSDFRRVRHLKISGLDIDYVSDETFRCKITQKGWYSTGKDFGLEYYVNTTSLLYAAKKCGYGVRYYVANVGNPATTKSDCANALNESTCVAILHRVTGPSHFVVGIQNALMDSGLVHQQNHLPLVGEGKQLQELPPNVYGSGSGPVDMPVDFPNPLVGNTASSGDFLPNGEPFIDRDADRCSSCDSTLAFNSVPVPGCPVCRPSYMKVLSTVKSGVLDTYDMVSADDLLENALKEVSVSPGWEVNGRKTLQFGCRYIQGSKTPGPAPEMPQPIALLARRVERDLQLRTGYFNTCIVNKYIGSQGISAHTDRDYFGDIIASVTMTGNDNMVFYGDSYQRTFCLPRKRVLVMSGYPRYSLLHAITRTSSSPERISITFRQYSKSPVPSRSRQKDFIKVNLPATVLKRPKLVVPSPPAGKELVAPSSPAVKDEPSGMTPPPPSKKVELRKDESLRRLAAREVKDSRVETDRGSRPYPEDMAARYRTICRELALANPNYDPWSAVLDDDHK